MTLAVVAYPELAEPDRAWIESIRQRHDPQAARIALHFTLVFPVASHVSERAAAVRGTITRLHLVEVTDADVRDVGCYVLGAP